MKIITLSYHLIWQNIQVTEKKWRNWAKAYYEIEPDLDSVKKIYEGVPIDAELIRKLNKNRNIEEALEEIKEIS